MTAKIFYLGIIFHDNGTRTLYNFYKSENFSNENDCIDFLNDLYDCNTDSARALCACDYDLTIKTNYDVYGSFPLVYFRLIHGKTLNCSLTFSSDEILNAKRIVETQYPPFYNIN